MISLLAYPARLARGKDGFWLVTFRDVKEAGTDDRDRGAALIAAMDALSAALAGYLVAGRNLPKASAPRPGEVLIHADPSLSAKASLRRIMIENGLKPADLGRLLKADKTEIRRMLDPDHPSKLDRLDRALRALGHRVIAGTAPIDPAPRQPTKRHRRAA